MATGKIASQLYTGINAWKEIERLDLRPVGSGHYNEVYEFSDGKEWYILRIAPEDSVPKLFYEIDMMHSEPPIHQKVRHHTNIPVPEIVFYDFSRNNIARDYLIMKKLPGREGGYSLRELGEYIAQLHGIKGEGFGYPDREFPLGETWQKTFLEYAEKIFSDCLRVGAITRKEYDAFLAAYKKHRSCIEECEPSLLHLDLWYTNILTENNKITAILCHPGL
ncbi:MAG: aminoglycoside phosphotransferase family protein [Caldiserica bacterium]|nr:aminoglycoside phosphotransferase family protein [Caldisericota bacterium]